MACDAPADGALQLLLVPLTTDGVWNVSYSSPF
jgi:hypothetical protein